MIALLMVGMGKVSDGVGDIRLCPSAIFSRFILIRYLSLELFG
jgi:hypothetical protein